MVGDGVEYKEKWAYFSLPAPKSLDPLRKERYSVLEACSESCACLYLCSSTVLKSFLQR